MKYIVLLCDGMADEPLQSLGGKTPLEKANAPCMDMLASGGVLGMVQTVPESLPPASDVANLEVLGYDAKKYYTGRAPLEALSMGVPLRSGDVAVRCNLVTISDDESIFENKRMLDHSAGAISTAQAKELILALQQALSSEVFSFFAGLSYRHCMLWHHGNLNSKHTPPHDILGEKICNFLPVEHEILTLIKRSYDVLNEHPINITRQKQGLNKANCIWLWGEGVKPNLPSFKEKTGLNGVMVSAVDLLKGIAVSAKMQVLDVKGATGTKYTDYTAKANAALTALKKGVDFVYIHVEAPDECGHEGDVKGKIKTIEDIDKKLLSPLLSGMKSMGEPYKILLTPDHATPCALRTHTAKPVPFIICNSEDIKQNSHLKYSEKTASQTGVFITKGHELINLMLAK